MIVSSIYGRIGRDPKQTQTKNGKQMVTASVAVDVGKDPAESETLWVNLLAFERNAELLAKHQTGDMVGVTGKLTRNHYDGKDGVQRESWSIIVDSLHSSRTVRPGNNRPKQAGNTGSGNTRQNGGRYDDFDDPIPHF